MTALPVLMFQIELLRVYCSYSHAYIILLEAGRNFMPHMLIIYMIQSE